MRFFPRIIFAFISNLIALFVAANFIAGFQISGTFANILAVAGIFTALNLLLRPLLKLILSPIIILTLGLFTIVINASILYLLDILSQNVTIMEIKPLIYGTLLITAVNLVLHLFRKIL